MMTKEEYLQKRERLLQSAENALRKGDTHGAEEAEKIMGDIRLLDMENDTQETIPEIKPMKMPWMSDSTWSPQDGVEYLSAGSQQSELFLNNSRGMVDMVKEEEPGSNKILKIENALGLTVKGMVTGKWDNQELKNEVTTTSSGTLIPQVLSAQIIDIAREISLFSVAGVPVVPMKSNNVTISRVKKDPIFTFKAEGAEAEESTFELDGVQLNSKTCYGYAYVTIEAINSSQNLDAILKQVFAAAIANSVDIAMLYGQQAADGESYEDFAPYGIMNDKDILAVPASSTVSYDDVIKGAGAIRKNNGTPTAWAINAVTEEALELLKTTDGQYLQQPKSLDGLKKIVSNQLSHDESKGSDILVFDPKAMLIGIQNNIRIKIIEDEKCLKNGLVGFQIYTMQDCKVVRTKSICKITGVKTQ